jgi:pyruvate/2-oxoglutarate dehydrogenase complex dihydrolipoamide acyltransferase (E2) component
VEDTLTGSTQAAVDAALVRVHERTAADPDLVFGDVVEAVALECDDLDVAVQLCAQAMDFVPDTIRRRVFEAENADVIAANAALTAERDAVEAKARQRSAKAAATRAATLAREAEVEKAAIRSATCPECFQVRSASGVCGCD